MPALTTEFNQPVGCDTHSLLIPQRGIQLVINTLILDVTVPNNQSGSTPARQSKREKLGYWILLLNSTISSRDDSNEDPAATALAEAHQARFFGDSQFNAKARMSQIYPQKIN